MSSWQPVYLSQRIQPSNQDFLSYLFIFQSRNVTEQQSYIATQTQEYQIVHINSFMDMMFRPVGAKNDRLLITTKRQQAMKFRTVQ